MEFVSIAGIVLLTTFSVFVLKKRSKIKADYLLLAINSILALLLFSDIWVQTGLHSANFILQNFIPFLLFPVFISYVLEYVKVGRKKLWTWVYLPSVLFFAYLIADHYLFHNYNSEELRVLYNEPPWIYHLFYKGSQLVFVSICFWLLSQFKKHGKRLKANFSSVETIDLHWLQRMTLIYASISLFTLIGFTLTNLNILPSSIDQMYIGLNVIMVLAIFYLNFNGIKHYTIAQYFAQNEVLLQPQSTEQLVFEKQQAGAVKAPGLNPERSRLIYEGIVELFQKEQLYLTPQLKLVDLAQALNETSHNVSEVLNQQFGKGFYDFVNEKRVLHLKGLLTNVSKKQYTILALGLESGFNSKASINRIFKNQTGLTPFEYQKQHQSS